MQQHQAISILKKNKAEFQTKSAKEVLLNIGKSERLLSAELEKVAQTYNHLAALSHFEKAADRGSAVETKVDVPSLVDDYVKSAAPTESKPYEKVQRTNVEDLRSHFQPRKKSASDDSPAPVKQAAVETPEWAKALRSDGYPALRGRVLNQLDAVCSEIAKHAHEGHLDISFDHESAAHDIGKEAADQGIAMLQRFCEARRPRIRLTSFTGELKKRAFNVTTELSDKLTELGGLAVFNDRVKQAETDAVDADAFLEQMGVPVMKIPDMSAEEQAQYEARREREARAKEQAEGFKQETEKKPENVDQKEKSEETETGGRSEKSDKSTASTKSDKGSGVSVGGLLSKGVSSASGAINSANASVQNALSGITGKSRINRDQEGLDREVGDIERSIHILRMVKNDPVLREQDPHEVLQQYNAIAEVYPEAAANPKRILLALREAGSYQGLTLDSQKTMTDARKNEQQGLKQERENSEATHRIN